MRRFTRSLSLVTGLLLAPVAADAAPNARKLQSTAAPDAPAGAVKVKVETLAEGLANPWGLAFLPDGSILVTERAGALRVIRDGKLVEAPIAGTPTAYVKSQGGVFDILPHPDFATNNKIFLSYAAGTPKANATRVVSATFDGAKLTDIRTIFETKPLKNTPVHYGGKLALLPDRTLLITVGDGFNFREKAQDKRNGLGKIVRVNLDGSIPADNPFADGAEGLPEIWSLGHRNQQGLAVDAETGDVFETEHGPKGGDELNRIRRGANYGWPIASYGLDYSGAQITPFVERPGTDQPLKYWVPSIGPSGLAVYRADLFSAWRGDLLIGALARKALHRIDMENGKPVGEERYLVGERIREVKVGPDGAIYVTTEDHDGAPVGKVLRLTPKD